MFHRFPDDGLERSRRYTKEYNERDRYRSVDGGSASSSYGAPISGGGSRGSRYYYNRQRDRYCNDQWNTIKRYNILFAVFRACRSKSGKRLQGGNAMKSMGRTA